MKITKETTNTCVCEIKNESEKMHAEGEEIPTGELRKRCISEVSFLGKLQFVHMRSITQFLSVHIFFGIKKKEFKIVLVDQRAATEMSLDCSNFLASRIPQVAVSSFLVGAG